MKAIEMFKSIGYNLNRNDDDYVIYEKEISIGEVVITFCDQLQDINISYSESTTNATPSIDMELFKAIQSQLKEMGWI